MTSIIMSTCKRGCPPATIHDIDNDNAVAVALNISDIDNAVGGALNISDITITITPGFIFRHLSTGGTPRLKPMDNLSIGHGIGNDLLRLYHKPRFVFLRPSLFDKADNDILSVNESEIAFIAVNNLNALVSLGQFTAENDGDIATRLQYGFNLNVIRLATAEG